MTNRITPEEYVKRLATVNPDVIVLENYVNQKTKRWFKCKKCHEKFEAWPGNLIRTHHPATACPECAEIQRRISKSQTHEHFIKLLSKYNPRVEAIGTYVKNYLKVKVKCKDCGNEWEATPSNLTKSKNARGCDICSRKRAKNLKTITQKEFERLSKLNSPYITILGKYVRAIDPVKVQCALCGHIWSPPARNVMHGRNGCPPCNNFETVSENMLFAYMKEAFKRLKINQGAEPEHLYNEDTKFYQHYDIYFFRHKIALEYQGHYHHGVIKGKSNIIKYIGSKIRDSRKRHKSFNNGVIQIDIHHKDFCHIHNKKRREEFIKNLTAFIKELIKNRVDGQGGHVLYKP